MTNVTTTAALALTIAFTIGSPAPSRAEAPDACRSATESALRACKAEAQSDRWIADGKCSNLADPLGEKACERQAAADAKDALATCREQRGLRDAVCRRLGEAPYVPVIDPARFTHSTVIDNPYFPLRPGTTFVYEGATEEGFEHVEFSVTHVTRVILGVTCVEVHDVRFLDGAVREDTRDWFAQDDAGNVWYFGENTAIVDRGLPVDLAGTWTAGVDGAQPGLIMEARPAIGDFYRQEFLLGEAEDLAEVKSLTDSVTVPYGSFTNCLRNEESAPLAPGDVSQKFYAAGVGNLLTVEPNGDRSALVRIITE